MTLRATAYCQTCGVKFEYADTGSDYYHGVSADCPNGHNVCCLPEEPFALNHTSDDYRLCDCGQCAARRGLELVSSAPKLKKEEF